METARTKDTELSNTASAVYTDRLKSLSGAKWKRILNAQAPYQWNLRRLSLGRTLDVGCGIGRNRGSLGAGSIGVDHNEHSVAYCSSQGFEAYTPDDFLQKFSPDKDVFDSLLIAHVFEHLTAEQDHVLLNQYLPYLRPGGRVVIITPQEAGYASDSSHVEFMPFDKIAAIVSALGLRTCTFYSFPFPRLVGRWFKYNEFIFVAEKT